MQIIDLIQHHEQLYLVYLEDWSEEIREADPRKEVWYNKITDKGMRVKLALDENGNIG